MYGLPSKFLEPTGEDIVRCSSTSALQGPVLGRPSRRCSALSLQLMRRVVRTRPAELHRAAPARGTETPSETRAETNAMAMDPTPNRPAGPKADPGAERPARKVGLYDRARSGGMGGVAIAVVALIVLLIVLWAIFA
jgi:hypothetical protein